MATMMRWPARCALRPSLLAVLCLLAWLPALAYLGHGSAAGGLLGSDADSTRLRLSAVEWAGFRAPSDSQPTEYSAHTGHADHGHGGPGVPEVAATGIASAGGLLPVPGLKTVTAGTPAATLVSVHDGRPPAPPPR